MSLFRDLLIEKKRKSYYCEVEYLEADGNQWLDLGLKGNLNTKIEVRVYANMTTNYAVAGDFTTSTKAITIPLNNTSNGLYSRFGDKSITGGIQQTTGTYTIAIDKAGYYINGTKLASFDTTTAFTTDNNLMLFGFTNLGRNYLVGKVYYCKIWDNETLVRDFIPVLDFSLKPCMYDKISGRLFYNQNTTGDDFSYGREIHYVDYLESTGTQYIDTGYAFTDGFSWEVTFDGITKGSTLFGGRTSSIRTAILYQKSATQGFETTCPIAGMTGDATPFQLADLSTGKHTVKMSVASNKGSVWVDGSQVYNEQAFTGTYISGTTQALFADNFGSSVSEYTSSKVYNLKMWQGLTLVRDYLPAIDSNGIGFMFDKVTHTIYDNAGTGAFKYPAREIEYIELTGTQGIDTGLKGNLNTSYEIVCKTTQTESAVGVLFGSRSSASSNNISTLYPADGYNVVNDFGNYNSTRQAYLPTGTFPKLKIYNSKNKRSITNLDTYEYNEVTTTYSSSFTTPNNIHIGLKTTGYVDAMVNFSGYIYACKIWENDVLTRDFVPVLQDGQAGMLDKANNVFYPNAGTGTFTTGKIIESRWF